MGPGLWAGFQAVVATDFLVERLQTKNGNTIHRWIAIAQSIYRKAVLLHSPGSRQRRAPWVLDPSPKYPEGV